VLLNIMLLCEYGRLNSIPAAQGRKSAGIVQQLFQVKTM
jgi:hypothetical protein